MAEKVSFEADGKFLPAIALAMSETAFLLLVELAKQRGGYGPWFDKLRLDLEMEMENTVFTGMSMSDEPGSVEAAIGAIRFVFDRIKWPNQPNSPTV